MSTAMMAMTTSSSIRVKPLGFVLADIIHLVAAKEGEGSKGIRVAGRTDRGDPRTIALRAWTTAISCRSSLNDHPPSSPDPFGGTELTDRDRFARGEYVRGYPPEKGFPAGSRPPDPLYSGDG
jgi:hypothetical protein